MINQNHYIIVYMSSPDNPVFWPKFSVVFATYLTRFAFHWKLDFHVAMQGIWYYLSWLANLEQLANDIAKNNFLITNQNKWRHIVFFQQTSRSKNKWKCGVS